MKTEQLKTENIMVVYGCFLFATFPFWMAILSGADFSTTLKHSKTI